MRCRISRRLASERAALGSARRGTGGGAAQRRRCCRHSWGTCCVARHAVQVGAGACSVLARSCRQALLPAAVSPACRPQWAAKLLDPESGRGVEFYTSAPAIIVYTGNWLNDEVLGKGGARYQPHDGVAIEVRRLRKFVAPRCPVAVGTTTTLWKCGRARRYAALSTCASAPLAAAGGGLYLGQMVLPCATSRPQVGQFPNAVNTPAFPGVVLRPGAEYVHRAAWRFTQDRPRKRPSDAE